MSELYGYDKLDQLTSLTRGVVSSGAISSPTYEQTWSPDGNGNWTGYQVQQDSGSGLATTLDQSRTAGATDKITSVSNATGEASWATPAYDAAGNMTTAPQPGSEGTGLACKYDAWGRLTSVSIEGTQVAGYAYDGL